MAERFEFHRAVGYALVFAGITIAARQPQQAAS